MVALSVSLAPIVNHLVTGRPALELMTILSFELMVYTFITYRLLLKARELIQRNAGGISYLITKLISSSVLLLPLNILKTDAWTFFYTSVYNAIPGIIMLCILSQFCFIKLRVND